MIKCGIIGCGVIAPTHLAGYQQIPEAQVCFFCDLIKERAEKLAENVPGAKIFTDYREMLKDPELAAVSICTDHASHAAIFTDALNAGKHVICEKVPGRTPDDLAKMTAAAAAHPEVVASGIFQHRFNASNIALRKLIAEKKFGKLLTVNLNFSCLRTDEYYQKDPWRGTVAGEGGGVLINQAIHFMDQLRFLFGDIRKVAASSANLTHQGVIEVEDTVSFTAEFADGLFLTGNATNSAFARWRSALTISGTEAQVEFIDEKLSFLAAATPEKEEEIRAALNGAGKDETVHGKAYYGTGHTAQLADFISAITEKRLPEVTLAEAAKSAAFVFSIYEAAAKGTWVDCL
ncbi:MAG: Gfo/Idh/MocA family oxidoreductase [Lentisphaerae bacterium]|nr:Gfo/Idh/MocA family oxidoreductase [Lentisphaerota bacterium]